MTEGPPLARPGGLLFRPHSQATLLAGMAEGARRSPPLATLNTAVPSDFTNALMASWARACNVLSFYQQRIVNEGYLPTAVEALSVVYLAAEIGERRRPALGAVADIALRLADSPATANGITVRPGPSLTVQNAPASPRTLPSVFECAETAELRPEWNAIAPVVAPVPVPATLWPGCRSIRLSGTTTGLRPGGAVLLTVPGGESARKSHCWLALADIVQPARSAGCTLVTWRTGIPKPDPKWNPPVTAVTVFPQSTGLFGRAAAEWSELPDRQKEAIGVRPGGLMALDESAPTSDLDPRAIPVWRSAGPSPPPGIQALLALGNGRVLAATGRGIFQSERGGTWQPLTLPPRRNDVLCLHAGCDGKVYAGTTDGFVLASADGGDSWAELPQEVRYRPEDRAGWLRRLIRRKRKKPATAVESKLAVPVHAIATSAKAADAAPEIYAGTDQGVFVMEGDESEWRPHSSGLPRFNPQTGEADVAVVGLVAGEKGPLTAATAAGVFTYERDLFGAGWTPVNPDSDSEPATVRCTCAVAAGDKVFVGTAQGVFFVSPFGFLELFSSGKDWMPAVSSLAAFNGRVAAATGDGIFVTGTEEAAWISAGVQEIDLFSVAPVVAEGLGPGMVPETLFERFERFGIELEGKVDVVPLYDGVKRYARIGWELREGPPNKRVFRIYDGDRIRVAQWIENAAVDDIVLAAVDGGLFASFPLGPVLNRQWPDFAIDVGPHGAEIYLDRRVTGVEPGSGIVLVPAGKALVENPEVNEVLAVDSVVHKAFGRQGIVTRIVVEPTAQLLAADLRTTDVYLLSRAASPFTATAPPGPVAGDALTLAGVHSALAKGRKLQVSGPRAAAAFVPAAASPDDPVIARAPADAAPALDQQMVTQSLAGAGLSLTSQVTVVVAGASWLVRDGDRLRHLVLDGGEIRIFAAPLFEVESRPAKKGGTWILLAGEERIVVGASDGTVWPQPAASTQAVVTELATVADVTPLPLQGVTRIALEAPLASLYDSARCTVCANVVHFSQGETVIGELLGSGDPAMAGQSFRLHHAPLTYGCEAGGYGHPALKVAVNGAGGRALPYGPDETGSATGGEHWQEIETLAFAGSSQHVYSVSTDIAGRATLHFGDGVYGARLPAGIDNVRATYRFGAGESGNVAAASLVALRKRPPGIRSATNPCPATGGADAEAIERLRLRAPRTLRGCGRIVSLADYAAFAEAFPRVLRAEATVVEIPPRGPVIWLTVAAEGPWPISGAPRLREALAAAIEASRGDETPFHIADPLFRPFRVRLALRLWPNADAKAVEDGVRAALEAAFSLDAMRFGAKVSLRRLAAEAWLVPGVATAEPLSVQGTLSLYGRPARFDPATGAVAQAEWPHIDAAGIELDLRR